MSKLNLAVALMFISVMLFGTMCGKAGTGGTAAKAPDLQACK